MSQGLPFNLNVWWFGALWNLGLHLHLLHLGYFLRGRDFLLHLISFVLSFSILICWRYFGNFGKNPSSINKLICIINLRKLGKLIKCMKLRNLLIKRCSWTIKITRLLNCWYIYFQSRNNCFGLSVEDSRVCCRHCMWIRENWN